MIYTKRNLTVQRSLDFAWWEVGIVISIKVLHCGVFPSSCADLYTLWGKSIVIVKSPILSLRPCSVRLGKVSNFPSSGPGKNIIYSWRVEKKPCDGNELSGKQEAMQQWLCSMAWCWRWRRHNALPCEAAITFGGHLLTRKKSSSSLLCPLPKG